MALLSKNLAGCFGLALAVGSTPAAAQDQNQAWTVKPDVTLKDNFDLSKVKPDISFRLTKEVKKDKHDVSLVIGESRYVKNEQEWRSTLTRDMGDMGVAKLKWMKVQWTYRFGGPK